MVVFLRLIDSRTDEFLPNFGNVALWGEAPSGVSSPVSTDSSGELETLQSLR